MKKQMTLIALNFKRLFLITFYLLFSILMSTAAYPFCFDDAGKMYGVSSDILRAIAEKESSFDAYAINHNRNGSYDYGLMISHPIYVFM